MWIGEGSVNGAYWSADGGVAASDIDSTLFTHLFCAFANLDPRTNRVTIPDASIPEFTETVRRNNPYVKTLLSIGGGNSPATTFADMASQPISRGLFIESSIQVARSYGFSGLDLDWEYPRTQAEMENLGLLLKEWRAAVKDEAASSSRAPLLLTAAFYYAPRKRIEADNWIDYPIQAILESLDWVNAMAYDFYDPGWSDLTNAHSALYDPTPVRVSGSDGIQAWIAAGIPADKLVLGMPFYGKAWRLADPNTPGFLMPANGSAIPNNLSGDIAYRDVTNFIRNERAAQGYNADIVSNYCYFGTTWIGYDDVESISAKVSYAKNKGLRGTFAWQVSQDLNSALSRQAQQAWEA